MIVVGGAGQGRPRPHASAQNHALRGRGSRRWRFVSENTPASHRGGCDNHDCGYRLPRLFGGRRTLPGLAIFLTVMSLNFVGGWLRDRLDPRLRQLGHAVEALCEDVDGPAVLGDRSAALPPQESPCVAAGSADTG